MGMISKHVGVVALAALLLAGSAALAGDVGRAAASSSAPGKGPAGTGDSLGSGNQADECMEKFLKNSAQCRALNCDTYWISFFDNCDKWNLNLCIQNAQTVFDLCHALAKGG